MGQMDGYLLLMLAAKIKTPIAPGFSYNSGYFIDPIVSSFPVEVFSSKEMAPVKTADRAQISLCKLKCVSFACWLFVSC